ncbi:hypothetical protein BDV06DRAFT_234067 [Aspergillus oleicola]
MSRPLTLITGANQGIGLATAQILATKHNHHVLIGSRSIAAGEEVALSLRAQGHLATAIQIDLSSESSIKDAVATIEKEFGYLDVLINNAAVLLDGKTDMYTSTWDLYTKTFTPNVIGTGTLTETLLPLLCKAKKNPPTIIFVSSIMGSISVSQDSSTFWYATDYKVYDASKAAVNMLTVNYDRILKDVGGRVNCVCPGLVKSNLTGYTDYGTTTELGATRIVELATVGKEDEGVSGTFSNRDGGISW